MSGPPKPKATPVQHIVETAYHLPPLRDAEVTALAAGTVPDAIREMCERLLEWKTKDDPSIR